jgi:hypothetical protein
VNQNKNVDGRHKAGHDDHGAAAPGLNALAPASDEPAVKKATSNYFCRDRPGVT